MRRRWTLGLLACLAGGPLLAVGDSPREKWDAAQKAYQSGDFKTALARYQELADRGYGGAALDYNLGNAFYRTGQLGRARLWYERALKERPSDDDARHNRDLIRQAVNESRDDGDWLGDREGFWWALVLLTEFLFFGSLAAHFFFAHEGLWWGRWVGGLCLASFLGLALAARAQNRQETGVITAGRAEARGGPSMDEKVGFLVPEGQRVAVLDRLNGWTQIGLPDKGLKGWVPGESVEAISTREE